MPREVNKVEKSEPQWLLIQSRLDSDDWQTNLQQKMIDFCGSGNGAMECRIDSGWRLVGCFTGETTEKRMRAVMLVCFSGKPWLMKWITRASRDAPMEHDDNKPNFFHLDIDLPH